SGPRADSGITGRRRVRVDAWYRLDNQPLNGGTGERATGHLTAMFSGPIARLRNALRRRLRTVGEGGDTTGLAQALVLGESSALSRSFEDLTRRTGVRHLFAVSGMHVGIICLLLAFPLARRFGRGLGILALVLFVAVAGAGSPVLRAALAAALGLLAPRARKVRGRSIAEVLPARRVDVGSLWSLALAFELITAPAEIAGVGLQLSYLATAGILLGSRNVAVHIRLTLGSLVPARWKRPCLRPRIAVLLGQRLRDLCASVLAASICAVLATTPVTWSTFGEAAPLGLLLTPIALFPISAGLLAGLMAPLLPTGLVLAVLEGSASSLHRLLSWADHLPGTPLPLPERPDWMLALAGLLLLLCLASNRNRALGGFGLLVGGLLLIPWNPAPKSFELHVLDSGHGMCAIARGPGLPALIFDGGSRDRAGLYRESIAPLLARWDLSEAVVVLSHDDRDHQSALSELSSRYRLALWAGATSRSVNLPSSTPTASLSSGRVRLQLPRKGPVEAYLHRGMDAPGNEGSFALEFVLRQASGMQRGFPDRPKGRNRGRTRLLLMGDSEQEGLAAMLSGGQLPRDLALLLAPHHGSDTDLLVPLLEWTRPAEVWISCAQRPAIAEELERRDLPWRAPILEGPLSLFYPPP
ncbi:MAG: competence protein ComEC, partial [Planctomycetota bacterium]